MKKRTAPKAASRKTSRTRKAVARKAPAKKSATSGSAKPAPPAGRYSPPEIPGTGWPPFRYPPQ
jgi:hypothetical protein